MKTPVITSMRVVPVAGYDSMLMNIGGAHAPWFTRNVVVLEDSAGHKGLGEIHGGDYTYEELSRFIPLVVGKEIGAYRSLLRNDPREKAEGDDGEGIQNYDLSKLKFVVKGKWALECALLDLLGQYMELPMCELLGEGMQRDRVEVLAYLFYVNDKEKAHDLPYLDESDSSDPWYRMRRTCMMTPERIVEQAEVLQEKYGFRNFKLKGGVLEGETEMETMRRIKKRFPDANVNLDPNGAWSLAEAVRLCKQMEGVLSYIEDPCGPEGGYSGREIMAEFKNQVNMRVATNMIATDWRQFYHASVLKAVDIVLADPHFWGFDGAIRMSHLMKDDRLTWGIHSNSHFDITLAAFAQVAAAAVDKPAPVDTHYIWQDGQELLSDGPRIRDGHIPVSTKGGLGVTLDEERLQEANRLYLSLKNHDRDDALGMQYIIPGWKFDSKRPAMVR